MNLPIGIAEKLLLLQNTEKIPASKLQHSSIDTMLENGILEQQILGRSKKLIFLRSPERLDDYLRNHFGISNLLEYILVLKNEVALRSDFIAIASDSKLRNVRTFKGFLVNCFSPLQATLNNEPIIINPAEGSFQFIYDFETFTIPAEVTLVGIENPENFRHIYKQKYLFQNINPLFVCRYPQNQSKDLIKWLQSVPNPYLHFGDFDFAGIGIYLNEYKKYLGKKANFFVPDNTKILLQNYGNKALYANQSENFVKEKIDETKLNDLIQWIHELKMGLEQEIFILKYT